jgi:sec-independent protein translocase protein TatA
MINLVITEPISDINYAGEVGPWQIIIILGVILLFFGGRKIPELMNGIGKGIKSFKDGMKDEDNDPKSDTKASK